MSRTAENIDAHLKRLVARREAGRERILVLSSCIEADTRLIDKLLAERADLTNGLVTP